MAFRNRQAQLWYLSFSFAVDIYYIYIYIPNVNPLVVVGVNFFLWGTVAFLLTKYIKSCSLNKYLGI